MTYYYQTNNENTTDPDTNPGSNNNITETSISTTTDDQSASGTFRQFAWYYPTSFQNQGVVMQEAKDLGFTDLYLSINGRSLLANSVYFNQSYDGNLADLVGEANNIGIEISFMILQDPAFYNQFQAALLHLQGVESFIERHSNIEVGGYHYDIEPHAADYWDNETTRSEIFITFMDTLLNLGDYISNSSTLYALEASMAVPWWYNEQGYDSRYPSQLSSAYDYLVFMVYDGIGNDLEDYERVEDELAVMPGVLGYGYQEFNNLTITLNFRKELQNHYETNDQVIGTSLYRLRDVLN